MEGGEGKEGEDEGRRELSTGAEVSAGVVSVLRPLSAGIFLRFLKLYIFFKSPWKNNNRLWWLGGETWSKSRGNCGRGKGGRGKGGVRGIASLTRPTFGDGKKDRGRGNRSLGRRWWGGEG